MSDLQARVAGPDGKHRSAISLLSRHPLRICVFLWLTLFDRKGEERRYNPDQRRCWFASVNSLRGALLSVSTSVLSLSTPGTTFCLQLAQGVPLTSILFPCLITEVIQSSRSEKIGGGEREVSSQLEAGSLTETGHPGGCVPALGVRLGTAGSAHTWSKLQVSFPSH